MLKHYKIIFFVRFIGYLIFLSGLISLIFMLGPLIKAEISYRSDKIFGIKRTVPDVVASSESPSGQQSVTSPGTGSTAGPAAGPGGFCKVSAQEKNIIPVS